MSVPPDLAWDHSVGENLLPRNEDEEFEADFDNLMFYNGTTLNDSVAEEQDCIKLSRRHVSFLLRSLGEANSLLKQQRNLQDPYYPNTRAQARPAQEERGNKCRRWCSLLFNALMRYNLIITLILQALMLVCVTIIDSVNSDNHRKENKSSDALLDSDEKELDTYFVMMSITAINLCLIIYISVVLTKTLLDSQGTTLMLAQAYLSTVIMFAGLYVITYRLNKKGWTLHGFNAAKDDEVIVVSYLYLKMFFHSISTSTLCGSSTIHPDIWYNFVLVSIQMLLSFLYFTSILRVVIGPPQKFANFPKLPQRRLRRPQSSASLISPVSTTEQTGLLNGYAPGSERHRYYGGVS